MPKNLSLLPADEKNRIELDKQAAFIVWKIKRAKAGFDEVRAQTDNLSGDEEKAWFEQSIAKYKRVMGVA